jgi:hypothetical protein
VANIFGAHWAAVYISKSEKTAEYFDPVGSPLPFSIEGLLGTLAMRVGREVGGSAFKVIISKGVHQIGGVKCGLYSLNYIFRRLDGTKSFLDFSEDRCRRTRRCGSGIVRIKTGRAIYSCL